MQTTNIDFSSLLLYKLANGSLIGGFLLGFTYTKIRNVEPTCHSFHLLRIRIVLIVEMSYTESSTLV